MFVCVCKKADVPLSPWLASYPRDQSQQMGGRVASAEITTLSTYIIKIIFFFIYKYIYPNVTTSI